MEEGMILFERNLLQIAFLLAVFLWGPKLVRDLASEHLDNGIKGFIGFLGLLIILSVIHILLADIIIDISDVLGWIVIGVILIFGYIRFSKGDY